MDDIAYVMAEMKDLCDKWFLNPMIRPRPGANLECLFCEAGEKMDGNVNHTEDCPYIIYKNMLDNL